ncbi:MAG TPA: hypothetical protein VFW59_01735 [Gallionella sp.]|nr:hypothetical protein [Gallionella sp.]
MIETATLITLCMLFLIFFRPGKTPPLENPLVIERAGKYQMTLAPQLNLAQGFVEEIAKRVAMSPASSAPQYFAVHDKQVTAHGFDFYLLAVTQRNGMLYFQAARPSSKDIAEQLPVISGFADQTLTRFPDEGEHDALLDRALCDAVREVAHMRGIGIGQLTV